MKKLRLFILLPCLLAFNNVNAGIIYVKAGVGGSTNSGTSWANAYDNLQSALDSAVPNDTIWVAKGVYFPSLIAGTSTDNKDKTFLMKNHISIFGGFAGTENALSERVLNEANKSVLSGDLGIVNDTSDNVYHVLVTIGIDSLTTLDGFHIAAGNASGTGNATINSATITRNLGGGIYNENSKIILNNLTVDSNYSSRGGAGINNNNSAIELNNSSVSNNYLNGHDINNVGGGAGIRNNSSNAILNHVTIHNNYAYHVQGGGGMRNLNSSHVHLNFVSFTDNHTEVGDEGDGGGAMYNLGSNPILQNVSFETNSTDGGGGGIYNDGSVTELTHVSFIGNSAEYGGGMENDGFSDAILNFVSFSQNEASEEGGGIYNWKSSPVLTNVEFIDNSAEMNGGALHNYNNSSPILTNVLFKGNSADINGGAIYNQRNANPVITNALIINNSAGNKGGGLYNNFSNGEASSPIFTNVTVANNSALVSGGGGYDDGLGATKLRNSIISGNSAPYAPDIEAPIAMLGTAINSIIIDDEFYLNGVTPPVAFTGSLFVNTTNNDYRLALGSYALDKGDSSLFNTGVLPDLSAITTDINGANRIMGNGIDLGAYETCTDTLQPTISIVANPSPIVNQSVVTFTATVTNAGLNPTYEWFKNNTSIPNATTSIYSAVAGTDFIDGDIIKALLTSSYSCANYDTAMSNELTMDIETNGISKLNNKITPIRVFPNPNKGSFSFNTQVKAGKLYELTITDILGRKILREKIQSNTTQFQKTVQLNKLINAGVYFLSIGAIDEPKQVARFVIQ